MGSILSRKEPSDKPGTIHAGGGPASFSVRIVAVFQALNQFGRHCCSLFIREVERLGEELFGVHKQEGTTVWISILVTTIPATTSEAPTRRAKELAAPPMIANVMTTGGNPTPG
jgi:hypothetical protein